LDTDFGVSMPGQNSGDCDAIFSSLQRLYGPDGVQIKKANGDRPTQLKVKAPLTLGYNAATEQAELGSSSVLGPNATLAGVTADPAAHQGGSGVLWIAQAFTAPTAAPLTGIYLWYDGTNLQSWKAGDVAPIVVI
jgi:hypothetical protein